MNCVYDVYIIVDPTCCLTFNWPLNGNKSDQDHCSRFLTHFVSVWLT